MCPRGKVNIKPKTFLPSPESSHDEENNNRVLFSSKVEKINEVYFKIVVVFSGKEESRLCGSTCGKTCVSSEFTKTICKLYPFINVH
ncbi:hypothetical protein CEXT_334491 [Caerostris extrusa]|uniref:Uncharacterized protein n=1 Tax=Caerostris extrusa TaxID=172846 RepID=A0AAV4N009_CAEEX|nr:hypothetical protein CEXT_334491 [Caerostris extrusa]